MTITFQCPSCQATYSASDAAAGQFVRCPTCDHPVQLPPMPTDPAEESRDGVLRSQRGDAAAPVPSHEEKRTAVLTPVSAEETVLLELGESPAPSAVDGVESPRPPRTPATVPSRTADEADEPDRPFQPKQRLEDSELDMTPMVDVVFQLLIFFMLTAAFALQKSLTLPKPADEQLSENVVAKSIENSPESVIVRVDEFNTFHVLTVDWEEEAPSDQDLHIKLRRAREGNVNGIIPNKLLVEANGDALHGRVVAALDAGTATGFEEVQLATVEND